MCVCGGGGCCSLYFSFSPFDAVVGHDNVVNRCGRQMLLPSYQSMLQVSNKPLRSDIIKEVAALCLLGRLDPEGLEVQGLDGPPEGQTVHLVVQVRSFVVSLVRSSTNVSFTDLSGNCCCCCCCMWLFFVSSKPVSVLPASPVRFDTKTNQQPG